MEYSKMNIQDTIDELTGNTSEKSTIHPVEIPKNAESKWRKLLVKLGVFCVIIGIGLPLTVVLEPAFLEYMQDADREYNVQVDIDFIKEMNTMTEYIRVRNSKIPIEISELIATNVISISKERSISTVLVLGIIEKESLFESSATSSAGAKGLMQILKGQDEHGNEVQIDKDQAYNIKYNIITGIKIFKGKLKTNGGNLAKSLNDYSGNAEGYANSVYENIGRYVMYREKKESKRSEIDIVRTEIRQSYEVD